MRQKSFKVRRLKGYVGIQIPDITAAGFFQPGEPCVDGIYLGGQIPRVILSDPVKLNKAVLVRISTNNLVSTIGRPIADDDPLGGRHCLTNYSKNCLLDIVLFVIGSGYQSVTPVAAPAVVTRLVHCA